LIRQKNKGDAELRSAGPKRKLDLEKGLHPFSKYSTLPGDVQLKLLKKLPNIAGCRALLFHWRGRD